MRYRRNGCDQPSECSTLARTFDVVRFFLRSTGSTMPRRRQPRGQTDFTLAASRPTNRRRRWRRFSR